jgi:hypothetical protein
MVCTPRSADGRHDVEIVRAAGETNVPPVVDVIDSRGLRGDGTACAALRADGPVGRVRNPDIWEALGTSIIRQVIRAAQARKLYRAFCEIHGERVDTAAGPVFLFPTPETVLALSDDEFAGLGMKFFRVALRNAADAFAKAGDEWATLSPAELVRAVQAPRRIGPWTAGATVRTWAGHLAPSVSWPPSPTSPTTTASIRSPTSPPRPNTSSAGPGARWPARSCPSGRCRWVGFNLLAPTYEISARIAERLDRDIMFMLGGHQAKAMPSEILTDPRMAQCESLVIGEGETRVAALLDDHRRRAELPGVTWLDPIMRSPVRGGLRGRDGHLTPDINGLPFVDRDYLAQDPHCDSGTPPAESTCFTARATTCSTPSLRTACARSRSASSPATNPC